ncbi:MAG: hypothetical protein EOP07_09780 [Proteobacteria bacterium]|nr:MAG: hypothetical protein EOP07_09780 [Pseudomonadota bacterium]
MKKFQAVLSSFVCVASLSSACKTTRSLDVSHLKAEDNGAPEGELVLSSGPETLLVYNAKGPSQLIRLNNAPSKIASIDIPPPHKSPGLVRNFLSSKFDRMYVLSSKKLYTIKSVDGTVETAVDVPEGNGFAIDTVSQGYFIADNVVSELNPKTGKFGRSLSADADVWTMTDTQLLLANANELTIVDKETFKIVGTVKLEGTPDLHSPLLSVSWDAKNNFVYLSGSPIRPRSLGAFVTVDLQRMAIKEFGSPATFSGARFALNKLSRFIEIQHTSTPVSSTHVMMSDIQGNASMKPVGSHGTMYDLFETNDNLQFNDSETLSVMSSACLTGFCAAGKGLIFYDLKNDKRLPNLTLEFLGFQPHGAYFFKK